MGKQIQILVVDDNPTSREMLREYLTGQGYSVREAGDAPTLRKMLVDEAPQFVLLDVDLPGEDGLSLARYVREHFDIGIILVSGASETVDKIIGLEVGADDYVGKPFDPRELLARIKSVLRRYQRPTTITGVAVEAMNRRVTLGVCSLDLDARLLAGPDGANIPITSAEFDLLKVFVERPNRPLNRDQLLLLTKNREWDPFDRSIDIRVARLRRKVEPDANKPQLIRTVRGVGYMFVPSPG